MSAVKSRKATAISNLKLLIVSIPMALGAHALANSTTMPPDNTALFWQQTGISRQDLINAIPNEECEREVASFAGCLSALDFLGSQLNPKMSIALGASVIAERSNASLLQIGGLTFAVENAFLKNFEIESPEKEMTRREQFEKFRQDKRNQFLQYQQLYRAQARKVDFTVAATVLFERIMENSKNHENEGVISAMAFNAMLSVKDPHTYLANTKAFQEMSSPKAKVSLYGVGVFIRPLGKKIFLKPMRNSPAIAAGIRVDDVLTGVGSYKVTEESTVEDVSKVIRGPIGTQIVLKINRNGKNLSIPVKRAGLKEETVTSEMFNHLGAKIGYVRLADFMNKAGCSQMMDSIANEERKGIEGLVLDLRGNGGGHVDVAKCIVGLFTGDQVIALGVRNLKNNNFINYPATHAQVTTLKMVTLIDSGSASASEIVSGALQDHQRSWIVGDRSFGKGTVQHGFNAGGSRENGILLFQTVEQFYQPSGRSNQLVGIKPDFAVPIDPSLTEDQLWNPREADLYDNVVANVSGDWEQPRPEEVSRVKDCMIEQNKLKPAYEAEKAKPFGVDYQILAAQAVLACI